ncbi:MAG: cytochrome P450 [Bacteroidia bacterium]|nr:cytochrome P450 [Bacteroidia bacterium]
MDKKYHLPPHPPVTHFFYRNAHEIVKDKIIAFEKFRYEMGPLYEVKTPFRKVIATSNPDHLKQVLQENNKNYTKSFAYDKLRLLLGNGLLTSEGDFWRRQRRLAQPAFYKEKLAEIGNVMIRETETMLKTWESYGNTDKPLNITQEMTGITLSIVARALFFSDLNAGTEQISKDVTTAIEEGSARIDNPWALPVWVPTPHNQHIKKTLSRLDSVIYGMIEGRRKSGNKYMDLLSMLMDAVDEETGESMENLQLRDEVMTIFIAGHETTATALHWIVYLLMQNPDKLRILENEIQSVLGNSELSVEKLRSMPYLKQVIEEGMRLYPPAYVVGRRSIHADTLDGYDVPPGYNVVMPVYVLHRDPEYWENPLEFKPERFHPDAIKQVHKYAYLPFGGGPRLCIGNNFAIMEMQIVLAMMLQLYSLEFAGKYNPELNPLVTLRPKHFLNVFLKKR